VQVEYTLTKKGNAFNSLLGHMAEFSAQYEPKNSSKIKNQETW